MSTANILVRPGFDINLEQLDIFGEEFAQVALYTTPEKGIKLVDTVAQLVQPNHLNTLDMMIVINSTVGLMDNETRIQRQDDVTKAFRHYVYAKARVGTYIILSISSNKGEGHYNGLSDEMTMEAAALRARARIRELRQSRRAS